MTYPAFIHIGSKHIVNLGQIVSVKRLEPEAAHESYNGGGKYTVPAKPFRVEVTLTSVELESLEQGETTLAAASESQTITVSGDTAEKVWNYFSSTAIIPEAVPA